MKFHFTTLQTTRQRIIDILKTHSLEQLNEIPVGFRNNLIWNAAHCIATQQILTLKNAGLAPAVEEEFIAAYKKGSAPSGPVTQNEVNKIRELLKSTAEHLSEEYSSGKQPTYTDYTTSYGVTLTEWEEAILFNNTHEGLHLGYMMALKKSLP